MGALVDAASARLGCLLRAQSVVTAATAPAPAVTAARLTLYDFEASPWCRRVRECAQGLGLPLRIRPCPRQTVMAEGVFTTESAYRGAAGAAGGRVQFPLLVDESAGRTLYQSGDIVAQQEEPLEGYAGLGAAAGDPPPPAANLAQRAAAEQTLVTFDRNDLRARDDRDIFRDLHRAGVCFEGDPARTCVRHNTTRDDRRRLVAGSCS